MEFIFSPEDQAFRQQIRQFLREHMPAEMAQRGWMDFHPAPKADRQAWQALLHAQGWGVPHWPRQFGGTDWSPIQHHIFEEECSLAFAPLIVSAGISLLAPVLQNFGSKAQQDRYLGPIARGEELWMQGFSEPGAGSDLASLRTSAMRDGDHYVVNGQKTWSSEAQYAKRGFFLVRTDPTAKPQKGISFLIIDLDTPGVTIRPIIGIDGNHNVNEVFLEQVRVPVANLVGEENKGWDYAKFLLGNERTASAEIHWTREEIIKIKHIARHERTADGATLWNSPDFRRKIARLEMDLQALEWSVLRVLCDAPNRYDAAAVTSALKVRGSELQQRATELGIEALGEKALRFYDGYADPAIGNPEERTAWPDYVPGRTAVHLYMRAATVYGGAREVQKNIIAKRAFGL
ncbi:MAG: acyl-CoA dehydrogenase family protein [Pseudomonadota bacterium]